MLRILNPSFVIIFALLISAVMTLVSNGKVNWEKLATDSITYYFVYMRGKNDNSNE